MMKLDELIFNEHPIDEQTLTIAFKQIIQEQFQVFVRCYENYITPIMLGRGWKIKDRKERSVTCTYGTVTYVRAQFYREGETCFPVDKKLGFLPRQRISKELQFQCVELATMVPEREVCNIISQVYQVDISPMTVDRAMKQAAKYLEAQKEHYTYYEEFPVLKKIKSDLIVLEADGVTVKAQEEGKGRERLAKRYDISRLIIHTGSKKVGNRSELQNKFEVSGKNSREVFQMAEKILEYFFEPPTEKTLFLTNSDGGTGYRPYSFHEFAKLMGFKRHEHFWDPFHIKQEIRRQFSKIKDETVSEVYRLIEERSKPELDQLLKECSKQLEGTNREDFEAFRKRIIREFKYTSTPQQRGLFKCGVGSIESNHRKITFRMKHRSMYWTKKGGLTMARLIVLRQVGRLRELFFGDWLKTYEQYKQADEDYRHPRESKRKEQIKDMIPKKVNLEALFIKNAFKPRF